MRISVIIATRNRAASIPVCLDSVAAAIGKTSETEIEIVVVDNNSTDTTSDVIRLWSQKHPSLPLQLLFEPEPGLSRSQNRGIEAAKGDLLVFTDDDCRLQPDYFLELLRLDASDGDTPPFRGGRVELGDPTDLPLTTSTGTATLRWHLRNKDLNKRPLSGQIIGANMVMRRSIFERLGGFDINLGSGAFIDSAGDADYILRAYFSGIPLEYSPELVVFHDHGRKTLEEARKLLRCYGRGTGALYVRYGWRHPELLRKPLWHMKNALKETLYRRNLFLPGLGVSSCMMIGFILEGAWRYLRFLLRFRTR